MSLGDFPHDEKAEAQTLLAIGNLPALEGHEKLLASRFRDRFALINNRKMELIAFDTRFQ